MLLTRVIRLGLAAAAVLALAGLAHSQGTGSHGGTGGAGAVPISGGGATQGQAFAVTCNHTINSATVVSAARPSRAAWTGCNIYAGTTVYVRAFHEGAVNVTNVNGITLEAGQCFGQGGLDVAVGKILCNSLGGGGALQFAETWR
ncbi:MAG TPA: hypothetical protein VEC14_12995 [Reyranellaceae bacterium]|nr:hypothetical protein [Reyranellaceae bacterium]